MPLMLMAAFALKTSGQRLNFVLHIMHEHRSAEVSLQSSVTQNKWWIATICTMHRNNAELSVEDSWASRSQRLFTSNG